MADMPRLKEKYKTEIVSALEKELEVENINQVPRMKQNWIWRL